MESKFNQALWEKILHIDLSRVSSRLIYKLNFSPERAAEAIQGYQKYLYLVNTVGNMTPSEDVDEVWHAHVLHLPSYIRDCMETFGRVIWHIPKPIIDGKVICSGECNAGGNDNNLKPLMKGTDCEAFKNNNKTLSFAISVPVNEYANENYQEAPHFEKFVEMYFG